ncbi:hypothetical protein COV17_02885 [Candidatus Woesearchaeota archaeon CG10_big_fil_rev_8_21_14_0_10_36_11]|nr:MAG: hypothetical protein COV17_02885 [Candidatus Woesearchaeota archaeon CG10_big_fil_rev_8_21_14_0_10_36_11]
MTYIRTKSINKNMYAYVVESTTTPKGPRQNVKQYLGRVYTTTKNEMQKKKGITAKNTTDFLRQLASRELYAHGFTIKRNNVEFSNVLFSQKSFTLQNGKKNVVVKLNEGYLCHHTLQKIQKFTKTDDVAKDGFVLARLIIEAGMTISEEEFIHFYKLH